MNVDTGEFRALRAEVAELAGLTRAATQALGVIARRCAFDEAVIEAERARAVAEDRAARPRGRGHLRASRPGRGHLRPVGDDAS